MLFGVPIVASVIAMIYTPSALARPWPVVLSVAPVRLIQDIAGVTPLLFLNELPLYQPILQARFLEALLVVTILYLYAVRFIVIASVFVSNRLEVPGPLYAVDSALFVF